MAIFYVSKSGNDSNSGASYALSFLTISKALLQTGNNTIIVGAGLYNEKLTTLAAGSVTVTIYCDGVVVLDGTGIANSNPAINLVDSCITSIIPYTSGGQFIIQNHIGTNLISATGGGGHTVALTITNGILLSNSNSVGMYCGNGETEAFYLTNVVMSGFTTNIQVAYVGGNNTYIQCFNCTFYNSTSGLLVVSNATLLSLVLSQCIFSNITTAFNIQYVATITFLNDNLYYNVTNWIIASNTYTSLSQVQALNPLYDSRSQVGNPNFTDPTNNIFFLKQASPLAPNINVGAYPYSYTRGQANNPDSTWNITNTALNTGWYNPDGNITQDGVTGYFVLTGGTGGQIWSPVINSTIKGNKTTRIDCVSDQYYPTNLLDSTLADVRPNYQTAEVRASDTSFSQNDGTVAWTTVNLNMPFTAISGQYVQVRISFTSIDVGA